MNITNRDKLSPETPILAGEILEVTIPEPTGDECASATWRTPVKEEATRLGVDPRGYDTTYYITPRVAGCSNAIGSVGKAGAANNGQYVVYFDKSTTPATSPLTMRTLVHELGHNLGTSHARRLTCVDESGQRVAMSGACTGDTQGDPTDGMGTTGRVTRPGPAPGDDYSPMDPNPRLFAASRAFSLGWVSPSEVQTVTEAGRYRLRPLYCSADNGAPRALRMASTTPGRDYWLETRVPCGAPYDNFVPGSTHHKVPETTVNGLLIRQAPSDLRSSGETWLLDLHPATTSGSSGFVDAALSLGESFTDPLPGGMRFEITRIDADGTLEVHIW